MYCWYLDIFHILMALFVFGYKSYVDGYGGYDGYGGEYDGE